jgi:hypothetical protein
MSFKRVLLWLGMQGKRHVIRDKRLVESFVAMGR